MTVSAQPLDLDVREWRVAGALMLGAAAVVPFLPDGVMPGCPLRAMTGVPCPLCGMTTSVVAAAHLDVVQAAAVAPAGLLAVVTAVALLFLRRRTVAVPRWLPPAGLAAMWLWQLGRLAL